jgi:hypothetical protein
LFEPAHMSALRQIIERQARANRDIATYN